MGEHRNVRHWSGARPGAAASLASGRRDERIIAGLNDGGHVPWTLVPQHSDDGTRAAPKADSADGGVGRTGPP